MRTLRFTIYAATLLALTAGMAGAQQLYIQGENDALRGVGGPFTPPGTLFDNGISDGDTSLASQTSDDVFTARTADDFILDGASCASGVFDITRIRVQTVQQNAAPQAFGVDLFNDDGTGVNPDPIDGIAPIASFVETSQMNLGPFGATTSLFEASFDMVGVQLAADTTYWLSAYGADGAANAAGFNNFFASSTDGIAGPFNGVVIAPDVGIAAWTDAGPVLMAGPQSFSFAIDGTCAVGGALPIPTLGTYGIAVMLLLLIGSALVVMRRS